MSEGKTPPRIDSALAEWPARGRSVLEWEEAAEGVMARVKSGEIPGSVAHVSDEDLLAAPLPASPNEMQHSAAPEIPSGMGREGSMSTASRERDRTSLRDLAKMANMVPPSSSVGSAGGPSASATTSRAPSGTHAAAAPTPGEREENSGLIHLAGLAASEAQRGATHEDTIAAAPAATAATAARPSAAVSAPASAVPSSVSRAPATASRKSEGRWLGVGGLIAAAAVAAGVFVGIHHTAKPVAPATVAAAAPTSAPAAPAQTAVKDTVAPAPALAEEAEEAEEAKEQGVAPSTLPAAQASVAGSRGPAPVAVALNTPRAPSPQPAAAKPAAPPATAAAAAASPAPAASEKTLEAAMQQAAGTSSTATPAAQQASLLEPSMAPGSVPLKPSLGAVEGALRAALPGARACLGPDDPISRAMVTFRSDGSVESVSVTGNAAGKPAEACIRAALMKAHVAPFAQPSFSAPATVRPN